MWRNAVSMLLVVAMTGLSTEPVAYGQSGVAPDPQDSAPQYPPQQYPQSAYPQAPGATQYPAPGQYPQGPYSQTPENPENAGTDQQHGVARLSVVQGDVNVRRADNGELVAAIMNVPLMTQDHVQTSAGSRAEVQLDYGNLVRLAPNTDLGFADVEYHRYQLQLAAGTIVYRVLRNSNAQVEIDTPSIAIRPAAEGEYRISVLDDGTTQIAVRSGQVEIFGPRGSEYIAAGHSALIRGNPSDPEFLQGGEIARDQFDDWSANRDQTLLASQSYRYVSPDIYGADDLDAYGQWVPSQYGNVWQPQAPVPDWSPYSYGQWTSEPYYGWTWVDYAPWGWAPYHYGRWFWNGGHGWCWWPGSVASAYRWSPALVGFFGWGGGVGLAFGGLGWVALAPFERFHAWWGHGFGYGGGFGVMRGANLAGMYRNAAIRGGAMAAGYNSFGGPFHRFSPATRAQLSNAGLFRGQIPVSPTRASYQFSNRQAVANSRLAAASNRQFFVHQQFRSQNGFASSRAVAPNGQGAYGARGNYGSSSGGWQRFGDPGRAPAFRQNYTGGQEQSGWHRFGEPQQPRPSYNGGRPYTPGAYGGTNQYRPQAQPHQGYSGAYGGNSHPARPSYSAPSPHYSAPAPSRGGGGPSHGGGGHSGGGHSSSGGHHGR